MGGAPIQALLTLVADNIDLPHHALTDPGSIIRFDHFAHKLVPEHASVGIITFDQFKVGAANPCFADFDQRFVRFARLRDVT